MTQNNQHQHQQQNVEHDNTDHATNAEIDEAWNGSRREPLSTAAVAAISMGTLAAAVVARVLIG